jgi:hypothetical protein
MKLTDLYLTEAAHTREFTVKKWDGNDPVDVHIEPFDVVVAYHAEAGGSSNHPYGEGEATENHPDIIQVLSVTAGEPVHCSSEQGVNLDKLPDMHVSALITSQKGNAILSRVEKLFPGAALLKSSAVDKDKAMSSVSIGRSIFDFFQEHQDGDVIVEVEGNSQLLNDPHAVAMFNGLLSDGQLSWRTSGSNSEFTFTGRIIFVTVGDVKIDSGIRHKVIHVDMNKDKTYPKGTDLKDIPGWEASSMEFFTQKAQDDFNGVPVV